MAGSFEEVLKEIQAIHVKLNRQEEVLSVISGKLDQPVKIDNNIRYCRHGYEASDETSTDSLSCCSNTESTGICTKVYTGMYQGIMFSCLHIVSQAPGTNSISRGFLTLSLRRKAEVNFIKQIS